MSPFQVYRNVTAFPSLVPNAYVHAQARVNVKSLYHQKSQHMHVHILLSLHLLTNCPLTSFQWMFTEGKFITTTFPSFMYSSLSMP